MRPCVRFLCALRRVMVVASLTTLVTACATRAPTPSSDGSPYWNGRLSLSIASDPPQQLSAGFDLTGSPETGELRLSSPLGNILAAVRWAPGSAEWVQGDQITRRSSLDLLMTDLWGTALPVSALFDWLRGQETEASGWSADLTQRPEGRIVARRLLPTPTAELRIIVEP